MTTGTKFDPANFHNDGDTLTYGFVGMRDGVFVRETRFVARFKYGRGGRASFRAFLIKRFTVEEYFAAREVMAPLTILEGKGYILPHIRKWLKDAGYPQTREGYRAWAEAQAAARTTPRPNPAAMVLTIV